MHGELPNRFHEYRDTGALSLQEFDDVHDCMCCSCSYRGTGGVWYQRKLAGFTDSDFFIHGQLSSSLSWLLGSR